MMTYGLIFENWIYSPAISLTILLLQNKWAVALIIEYAKYSINYHKFSYILRPIYLVRQPFRCVYGMLCLPFLYNG